MSFKITRGTNISHWLSQSDRRGEERVQWFTEKDVQRIKAWGFDHLRLPVDEEQLWNDHGSMEPEGWALMDRALDWCLAAGLRVVVDLHILRSHHFNSPDGRKLFTDQAAAARFVELWNQLHEHLKSRPIDKVAYELLNEPVADDSADWNRVAMPVYKMLRDKETKRTIVLGSNRWNSVDTFNELEVPKDKNLILTFHYYLPMLITHYQASWWNGGVYTGPVTYPGVPVAEKDLKGLAPDVRKLVEQNNRAFGPTEMEESLAKPLAVGKATKLPLYCGEFGCYQKCPQPLRLVWYRDLMALFKRKKIDWANWDYKGGFGLITGDGKDTGIADAMLKA
jgi:endoglucanase